MADAKDYLEQWRDLNSFPNNITDNSFLTKDGSISLNDPADWNYSQLISLLKGSAIGTAENFYLDPNPLFNKRGQIYTNIINAAFASARTDSIKMNLRNMDYTNGINLSLKSAEPFDFFKFLIGIPDKDIYTNKKNQDVLANLLALKIYSPVNGENEPPIQLVKSSQIDIDDQVDFSGNKKTRREYLEYYSNWYNNYSYKKAFLSLFYNGSANESESFWNKHWQLIEVEDEEDRNYYMPTASFLAKFNGFKKRFLSESDNGLQLLMPQYHRRVEVEDLDKNFWVISVLLDAVLNSLWGPYGLIDVVRQLILKLHQLERGDSIENIELLYNGDNDLYFDMYSRFVLEGLQLKLISNLGERVIKNIFQEHTDKSDRKLGGQETTTNGSESVEELFEEITEEMYGVSYANGGNGDEDISLWEGEGSTFSNLFDSDLVRSKSSFTVPTEDGENKKYYASLSSVIDAINGKVADDSQLYAGYNYQRKPSDKKFFEIFDSTIGDNNFSLHDLETLRNDIETNFLNSVITTDQADRFNKYKESYDYLKNFSSDGQIIDKEKALIDNVEYEVPTGFLNKKIDELYSKVPVQVYYGSGSDSLIDFVNNEVGKIFDHLDTSYESNKIEVPITVEDPITGVKQDYTIAEWIEPLSDSIAQFDILEQRLSNFKQMGKFKKTDEKKDDYTVVILPEQHLVDIDVNNLTFINENVEENLQVSIEETPITLTDTTFFKDEAQILNYHQQMSANININRIPVIKLKRDENNNAVCFHEEGIDVITRILQDKYGIPNHIIDNLALHDLRSIEPAILLNSVLSKIFSTENKDSDFQKAAKNQIETIGLDSEECKNKIVINFRYFIDNESEGWREYTPEGYYCYSSVRVAAKISSGKYKTLSSDTEYNKITGAMNENYTSLTNQINKISEYINDLSSKIEYDSGGQSVTINKIPVSQSLYIIKNELLENNTIENILKTRIINLFNETLPDNEKLSGDIFNETRLLGIITKPFEKGKLTNLNQLDKNVIPLYSLNVADAMSKKLAEKEEGNKDKFPLTKYIIEIDGKDLDAIKFFFEFIDEDSVNIRDAAKIANYLSTKGTSDYWDRMLKIEEAIDNKKFVTEVSNGTEYTIAGFFNRILGIPATEQFKNYIFVYIDNPLNNLTTLLDSYIPTQEFLTLMKTIDGSFKEGIDWGDVREQAALLHSVNETEYAIWDNILIYLFDSDYYSLRYSNVYDNHFPSLYVRATDAFFDKNVNPLIPGGAFKDNNLNYKAYPLFIPRKDLINGEIIELQINGMNKTNNWSFDFNSAIKYVLGGTEKPVLKEANNPVNLNLHNSFSDNIQQYNYRTALFFKDTSSPINHLFKGNAGPKSLSDLFTQGIHSKYFRPNRTTIRQENQSQTITSCQTLSKDLKIYANMIASKYDYIDSSYELNASIGQLPTSKNSEDNYNSGTGVAPKECYIFDRRQAYCGAMRNNLVFYSSPSTNEYGQFIHSPLMVLESPRKFSPSTTMQSATYSSKGILDLKDNERVSIPYDVMGKKGDTCTLVGIKDMLYRNAYENKPHTIEFCWGRRDVDNYIKEKKLKYIVIEREKGERHKVYAPTCAGISISSGFLHSQNGLKSLYEGSHYEFPITWYSSDGTIVNYATMGEQAYSPGRAVYGVIDLTSKSDLNILGSNFIIRFYNSNQNAWENNKWSKKEFTATIKQPGQSNEELTIVRRPIISRVYFFGESDDGIRKIKK